MKFILPLLLTILMFLASFQISLFSVDYYLNRNFYETICINKDKPDMNCHGKCAIKKEVENNKLQCELAILGFEFNLLPQQTLEIPQPQYLPIIDNISRFRNRDTNINVGFSRILTQPPQLLT